MYIIDYFQINVMFFNILFGFFFQGQNLFEQMNHSAANFQFLFDLKVNIIKEKKL